MRRRYRRRAAGAVFLGAGLISTLWLAGNLVARQIESATTPAVTPPADVPFDLVIVQQGLDRRQVTRCQAEACQVLTPPASSGAQAITDGTWWYYYQDNALRRTNIQSGESRLLIEQTPLVRPREMYMSPDSNKVAFWLDNIDQPDEDLTELWTFDETAGGTRLLAEKVLQGGVLTSPRWNRAATHLWFLGEAGAGAARPRELLVVSLTPPGIRAGFTHVDWNALASVAAKGPMDISPDGAALVYAVPKTRRTSTLQTAGADGSASATTVRGAVPYVQWLGNDSILYATQHDRGVTFWRIQDGRHLRLAESKGRLQSVRADPAGAYAAFAAEQGNQRVAIFTLDLASGALAEEVSLPSFGSAAHVVYAQPVAADAAANDSTSAELDDAQIAGFIEEHLPAIARAQNVQPKRLIITDKPNTVFVDFTTDASPLQRAYVTIRDALHDEWSVSARYEERGGDWAITDGGSLNNPAAQRLYEWEPALKQWILKEEY